MAVCYDKSCGEVDSIKYKQVICIGSTNTYKPGKDDQMDIESSVGSTTVTRKLVPQQSTPILKKVTSNPF